MSSLQLEVNVNLTKWFIEVTFIASVIFALIYISFFSWRETKTGKAMVTLILAVAGALLRPVLIIWGIIVVAVKPHGFWNDFFAWLSTISLGAAGIAIITLTFKSLQVLFAESENKWICKLLGTGRKPSSRGSGTK